MTSPNDFHFDEVFHESDSGSESSSELTETEEFGEGEAIFSRKLTKDDFDFLSVVGQGGFGKVYQVQQRRTGEIYALKVLKKSHVIAQKAAENTRAERDILRNVVHPNIVKMHFAFQTEGKLYIGMDFVNGGQLFFHLRNHTMFSEEIVRFYAAQLVLAIGHLHSLDIIHRDLKPENILLDSEGHVILTDFGFAKENICDDQSAGSWCGTLAYMAPEMIRGQKYGKAVDWWSLGVLLFDMLTGSPPFAAKNQGTLQKQVLEKKVVFPGYLSPQITGLLKGLIKREPGTRLGSKTGRQELMSSTFFKGIHWNKLLHRQIDPPIRPKIEKGRLDLTNFDGEIIKQTPRDSPASPFVLSQSQEMHFKGFSYVRSMDDYPPPLQ